MCSFLLFFLIIAVLFDMFNCACINWHTLTRRQRRLRAAARRSWFIHRQGSVILGPLALSRLKGILSTHHSKDHHFLRKIAAEMASYEESYPWRCTNCFRFKRVHDACPKCFAHWSTGQRHNTEAKAKKYHEEEREEWPVEHEDRSRMELEIVKSTPCLSRPTSPTSPNSPQPGQGQKREQSERPPPKGRTVGKNKHPPNLRLSRAHGQLDSKLGAAWTQPGLCLHL